MKKFFIPIYYPVIIEKIAVWFLLCWRKIRYGYPFRKIELTQGKFAIVDAEDFAELNKYKWHTRNNHGNTFYAIRSGERKNGKKRFIQMHRAVMRYDGPLLVDHINGNGLDNRKNNLRIATAAQNSYNRKKISRRCSSKYTALD